MMSAQPGRARLPDVTSLSGLPSISRHPLGFRDSLVRFFPLLGKAATSSSMIGGYSVLQFGIGRMSGYMTYHRLSDRNPGDWADRPREEGCNSHRGDNLETPSVHIL